MHQALPDQPIFVSNRQRSAIEQLQIDCLRSPATPVDFGLEGNLGSLFQLTKTGALDRGDVDKNIFFAAFRRNETKTAFCVEKFQHAILTRTQLARRLIGPLWPVTIRGSAAPIATTTKSTAPATAITTAIAAAIPVAATLVTTATAIAAALITTAALIATTIATAAPIAAATFSTTGATGRTAKIRLRGKIALATKLPLATAFGTTLIAPFPAVVIVGIVVIIVVATAHHRMPFKRGIQPHPSPGRSKQIIDVKIE